MKQITKSSIPYLLLLITVLLSNSMVVNSQNSEKSSLKFIDYYFENASPLNWEIKGDTIKVSLIADYERETLNRQTDHWYFKLISKKGEKIKLTISKTFGDIYNGNLDNSWWNLEHGVPCYISTDRKNWSVLKTETLDNYDLFMELTIETDSVFLSRTPVYNEENLNSLKERIIDNDLVEIIPIGQTVEKIPLEIIRVGNPNAKYGILLRSRSHPWEPGGNWVIDGLIEDFLNDFTENKGWQNLFCYYIMPIANKDGVRRGMTRFNTAGRDLNRNWLEEIDPILAPENYALEMFVKELISKDKRPVLAIDFHNDSYGNINLIKPNEGDNGYLKRMELFQNVLTENSWFANKFSVSGRINGGGNMADGMYYRNGIDAFTYELNACYIEKLGKAPEISDWKNLGADLNRVFYKYLTNLNIN